MEISTSRLAVMDPRDREEAMDTIWRRAVSPRNGQANAIDERIRSFEAAHGMTSDQMRARLTSGELDETHEISKWLMLIWARDRGRR